MNVSVFLVCMYVIADILIIIVLNIMKSVNNNKYKVTVGMPVYGVEKYIRKCLLSILNQTFQEDIEIIIDAVHQEYIQATTNKFWNVERHYIKNRYERGRLSLGSLIKIKVQ